MNKHSVALIQHYYGVLPNYFPLWLKSAGTNPEFDFMILTDIDFSGYDVPDNVHIITMSFDALKARIAKYLDFEFACDTPYKACDYRLMYGLILQDYLEGYDFWGFCDPDMIWGNMSRFITPELLSKYDKFYNLGHLQFFRNTEKAKTFALHELPNYGISYRDIYSTSSHIAFEELMLKEELFRNFADTGGGLYYSLDFVDVLPLQKHFTRNCYTRPNEVIPAFRWKNGKVYGLSVNGQAGNDTEYLYVHLQKRAMNFIPGLEKEDSFLIIPNEFAPDHELTQEEINTFMTPDGEYERAMKAKYTRKGKGIISDIKIFLRMDRAERKILLHKYLLRLKGQKFSVWE